MLQKTEGIILQKIQYADKKSILKIYTRDFGLLTFNGTISNSKHSKNKPAQVQPLNQVEICFSNKQNREVQQLTETRITLVYSDLGKNYSKLGIAQFINEVLCKCLKEQHANSDLFNFIKESLKWLDDQNNNFGSFHLYFLFELSKHLGFEPLNNYSVTNCYFDVQDGKFSSLAKSFPLGLDKGQSLLFSKLFSDNFLSAKFSKEEKGVLVECLLAYYRLHVAGFNEMRTLQVLKEIYF